MCDAIVHRGPDDSGVHVEPRLAMGTRRLSIIDIAGAQQPLYNEDKTLVLVFNGEIYNYRELRQGLLERGHRFRTQGDGEVILHLYEEKGTALLDDLNGMFAFCLWDAAQEEGILARDRLGIKPLYYWAEGRRLAFASEIKALREAVRATEVDRAAIHAYLRFMYIPAPLTPFRDVRKLLPASYLRFSVNGLDGPKTYWHPLTSSGGESVDRDQFLQLVDDAVELQLRSDVPVGIFLSGGIDSSLVTRLATRKMGQRILAFTVDYVGASESETDNAARVAALCGCDHRVVPVDAAEVSRCLPRLLWQMDEPHGDSALVGTYAVSATAAREVKVVLNGTGGDELFGGYPWHYLPEPMPLRVLRALPTPVRSLVPAVLRKGGLAHLENLAEWCDGPLGLFLWRHFQFKPWETQGFFLDGCEGPAPERLLLTVLESAHGDPVTRMLLADLMFYLTDDLLLVLDKMTMVASLEGRVPFLDHRVVELAFRIPGTAKLAAGRGKELLRQWLRDLLPDGVLTRGKVGFGAPVDSWMREGLLELTRRILSTRPASRYGLFWGLQGPELRDRLRNLTPQRIFLLLCLEVWARVALDGVDPQVDLGMMAEVR